MCEHCPVLQKCPNMWTDKKAAPFCMFCVHFFGLVNENKFSVYLYNLTCTWNYQFYFYISPGLYPKFNFGRALACYISPERIWILTSLSISHSLIIFIKKSYEDWHPKHWNGWQMERCISCMSHYLRTGLLVFGMWCYVEHTRTLNPWRRWRTQHVPLQHVEPITT